MSSMLFFHVYLPQWGYAGADEELPVLLSAGEFWLTPGTRSWPTGVPSCTRGTAAVGQIIMLETIAPCCASLMLMFACVLIFLRHGCLRAQSL